MATIDSEAVNFQRVVLGPLDTLNVRAGADPVAIWVPSNYQVFVTSQQGVTLDIGSLVQHHDVVSLHREKTEVYRALQNARKREKRARRKLRTLDRKGSA